MMRRPPPVIGLSPRVRGNPPSSSMRAAARRSIPACAGEPVVSLSSGFQGKVYPRVCGGTGWLEVMPQPTDGLSPRVRGNRISW